VFTGEQRALTKRHCRDGNLLAALRITQANARNAEGIGRHKPFAIA
jgi:hypothetical protein